MNKKLYLALSTLFFLSSCQEADVISIEQPSSSVSFSTYVPTLQSRASTATSETLKSSSEGFGVFAIPTGADSYNGASKPSFMHNQQVAFTDGKWCYSPLKYWPADANEKISFFAYAPYASNPSSSTSGIASLSPNSHPGNPYLSYVIDDDPAKHIDLLYAKALDKKNSDGSVQLDFKHALCKVGFKLAGWVDDGKTYDDNTSITVNAISLSTKRQGATLDLCTGAWSIPTMGANRAFVLSGTSLQNNALTPSSTQGAQINKDDCYLMLLPDLSEDGRSEAYCLLVDYTVSTADPALQSGALTIRNKTYQYFTPGFEQGKAYSVNIRLGLNSNGGEAYVPQPDDPLPVDPNPEDPTVPSPPGNGGYVSFSTEVDDWEDSSSITINESSDRPLSVSLNQEGFSLKGRVAGSSRAGRRYVVVSLKELDQEKNFLKAPIEISSGDFVIPATSIKWEEIEGSTTLVAGFEEEDGTPFQASVDVELAYMAYEVGVPGPLMTIRLPFGIGPDIPPIMFDYGDGEVSDELRSLTYADLNHDYRGNRTYLVKIMTPNPSSKTQCPEFISFPTELTSLKTPLLASSQTNFSSTFKDCAWISSIPSDLFANNADAIYFFSTFKNCSALNSIPADLFKPTPLAKKFSSTFSYCSKLESIPESLFKECANAENFYETFKGCRSLKSIPKGLFANCPAATSFEWTFMGCASLTSLPAELFKYNAQVQTFEGAFQNCSGLRTIPGDVFGYSPNTLSLKACFMKTNLASVPDQLLDCFSNATNFDYLFYQSGLASIPSALFMHCTEMRSANMTFGANPISSIPDGLFDACSKLEEVGGTFCQTGIATVPNGLFKNNHGLVSVCNSSYYREYDSTPSNTIRSAMPRYGIFLSCSSLTSIPSDLFDNCPNITSFRSAFEGCRALASALPELWERSNVTDCKNCFSYCINAENYADVPDDWK